MTRKEELEQQAKEIQRLNDLCTAWRNIQQEEMCYVMREVEALGIDFNKSVISDGLALWDVSMERIAQLRKAEEENKTLREALQKLVNEVNGLLGIEEENIRNLVGNTNINVLNIRIANAQQVLKKVTEPGVA